MKDIFELSEDRKTLLEVVDSNIEVVKIPNGVICIGNGAFWGCSSIKSITIPNSVTTIESEAFKAKFQSRSIIFPKARIKYTLYTYPPYKTSVDTVK